MAQVKEQIKTLDKELNKMGISNQLDAEFKTLVIRMLKELSEDLSSIKMTQNDQSILIQSETKDTLIEIKNNLKGNNSRVDKAENEINDLEHLGIKTTNKQTNNTTNQNNGKKIELPKVGIV